MLQINGVVGDSADPSLHERLHHLEHHGAVDEVTIPRADMSRRRLRITTPKGVDLAIALHRDQKLFDGAVLMIDNVRAIVVRAEIERWLQIQPGSIAQALELGYHVGNLHWRVRFKNECIMIALEGPVEAYQARLDNILAGRHVRTLLVDEAAAT